MAALDPDAMSNQTDSQTVVAQRERTTSAGKFQYASPETDPQTICTSYLHVPEGEEPAEYLAFEFGGDSDVTLYRSGFSGSDDEGNYAIYETEGGMIEGLYVHRDTFEGEAPEEVSFDLIEADESDFEEQAEEARGLTEAQQEEAAALLD